MKDSTTSNIATPLRADEVQAFLHQAREGKGEALDGLMLAVRDDLVLIAGRVVQGDTNGETLAAELVRETEAEARRDFSQFYGNSYHDLITWMRRILATGLLRRYVSSRGELANSASPAASQDVAAVDTIGLPEQAALDFGEVDWRKARAQLDQALARLSEEDRQVITMRHRDRLSFGEIGQQTNRTPNGARKLWARAFERLSQELEGAS